MSHIILIMAPLRNTLIWGLFSVLILIQTSNCNPVRRSTADCYGTDCVIDQDILDLGVNYRATKLLESINGSLIPVLPEMTDLLKNIAFVQQNTTAPALPSMVQLLEDDKNLQASQNLLIENGTTLMAQMVKVLQSQQATQERHYQSQQEMQERHYQNHREMQERHNQLMHDQADRQNRFLENITVSLQPPPPPPPKTCIDGLSSGQHTILPNNTVLGSFPVVCDMDTDDGGWIVFQRRFNGSVDFDRVWDEYENGFGSLDGEFWLGLQKLHVLTSSGRWELRVDLEDFDGNTAYAVNDNFRIGDSSSFYRLGIGSYSGTAGDAISYQNGRAFTTKDQDHDLPGDNCAVRHRGAWWHSSCTRTNLNGLYLGQTGNGLTSMHWYDWKGYQSLKKSELKIRLI